MRLCRGTEKRSGLRPSQIYISAKVYVRRTTQIIKATYNPEVMKRMYGTSIRELNARAQRSRHERGSSSTSHPHEATKAIEICRVY